MDMFSKVAATYPLASKNTDHVQKALNSLMDDHKFMVLVTVSLPFAFLYDISTSLLYKTFLQDQEAAICSHSTQNLLAAHGVVHRYSRNLLHAFMAEVRIEIHLDRCFLTDIFRG